MSLCSREFNPNGMKNENRFIDRETPVPPLLLWAALLLLAAAYIAGLFPDIMEVDAAQYASIAREMAETGEYLQVKHRYADYLDKPPLLFWLSSLSISAFGVSAWAYKLPSFLFTLLGLWSVFRFTLIYYPRKVAWYALFILASCQAWFMFNNDVRTDTLLAGAVIFSVWQLSRYIEYKSFWGLILGSLGIAAAMLAKGPIGLMSPVLAIGSHLFFSRNWKGFFKPGWLLMLIIVGALLMPMSYGLFKQYGYEGLKFFFWTQSFGRITGENEWRNDAGYFYFTHTFLWAFLPWALLAIPALLKSISCLIKNKFKNGKSLPETASLFGFILPFIALSFSHYKLPHYIFVTFPFMAVITASFIYQVMEYPKKSLWATVPLGLGSLGLICISGAACMYVFPFGTKWVLLFMGGLILYITLMFMLRKKILPVEKIVFAAIFSAGLANIPLNTLFYPELLNYQPGKTAAEWLSNQASETKPGMYYITDHPLEFHAKQIFPYLTSENIELFITKNPNHVIYTNEFGKSDIEQFGYKTTVKAEFKQHHPGLLTINFLNPKTRESSLQKRYWLSVEKQP